MLRSILPAFGCASKVQKLTRSPGMFHIPGAWLGPSLSNFGHPGVFTSSRALVWSPAHRHPWSAFNSFSPVFLHPVCGTGGGNPWAVFRSQFSHWGRYDGRAMQHSRLPYQVVRWTSDAYQRYVKTPVESNLEVSGRLL